VNILLVKPFTNTPIAPLPMGLLYIGSAIKRAGHNVTIIDAHINKMRESKVISIIKEVKPDVVGITCMTSEALYMRRLSSAIKSYDKKIKTILGGPHISSFREYEFSANPNIDYGIIGEGEISTLKLLEAIQNNAKPSGIKGVIYRDKDEIISTGEPEFIEDLNSLPLPDFSLIEIEKYFSYFGTAFNLVTATDRVYPLMYSRGCPFGCKYCHNIFGKRIRYFSVDRIFEEIRYVKERYNVKEIDFLDDTINVNQKRVIELFERLKRFKKELIFAIPSGIRGDLLGEELLSLFKEIRLFRVNIAYESGSQEILNLAGKNIDLDRVIENTFKIRDVTQLLGGFFMFGFPNEREEDIHKTIELMLKLPLHSASVSFVTAFPGTEYFPIAVEKYGLDRVLNHLIKYDVFYSEPLSLSPVEPDKLIILKKHAMKRFYLSSRRIAMNLRDVPNYLSLIRNGLNVLRLAIFKNVPY
jgi:radical SAM superfamily enzyme YgiQ (UPF0313 family)